MRLLHLLPLLFVTFPIYSQIAQMSTTYDGDVLYFAIKNPLRESGEPWQGRIFRVGPLGLELVESRERVADPNLPPGSLVTNYFELSRPEVSDPGLVTVFTGARECYEPGISCPQFSASQATVVSNERTVLPGPGRLSANGRFVLVYPAYGRSPFLSDLIEGTETDIRFITSFVALSDAGRVVANDGTIVHGGAGLWVFHAGQYQQLLPIPWQFPDGAYTTIEEPVIDGPARRILYTARSAGNGLGRLRMYDLTSKMDADFLGGPGETYSPMLSTDGSRALFLSTVQFTGDGPPGSPQLFTVNTDGSDLRRLTDEPGGVLRAVLSGDGRAAWYVAASGRLIRLNLESGARTERLGPISALYRWSFPGPSPGSMMQIPGEGFTAGLCLAAASPVPEELCGVRVRMGDAYAPILWVTGTEIMVQAPWETPIDQKLTLSIEAVNSSPFEANLTRTFESWDMGRGQYFVGGWFGHGRSYHLARHADSGRWVTPEDPLSPGDLVDVYGYGLGDVTIPQQTGVPASDDPPIPLREPLSCVGLSPGASQQQVEVTFAGLEPYQLGMYRLTLRVPSSAIGTYFQFSCGAGPGVLPLRP